MTRIPSPDESKEYFFEEGCYILEILNTSEDPQVSIARARVPPGVTTRTHRLNGIRERYLILSGTGLVKIGDDPERAVAAGDVVNIPPAYAQRIANTGETDLVFLAICTPRFVGEAYREEPDPSVS